MLKRVEPYIEFRNMDELLAYTDTDEWENNGGYNDSRTNGRHFTLTADWAEAAKLARTGWHEGVKDMSDKLERIENHVKYEPANYYWDVTGLSFDIGTVMTGEPECWLEQDMEPRKKMFRIHVNPSSNGDTTVEQLMNRGAAVVALVNLLQSDPNNIVELDIYRVNSTGTYVVRMGLGPIDLDALAFCMAHPSYNRRLMFAITEKQAKFRYSGNYGSSVDGMEHQTEAISTDEDGTTIIYIPRGIDDGNMTTFNTIEGSAQWVNRMAKELLGGKDND